MCRLLDCMLCEYPNSLHTKALELTKYFFLHKKSTSAKRCIGYGWLYMVVQADQ